MAGQQAPAKGGEAVTFTKDIAPILQRSCQNCHRPNSIAPMSLLTYEEVRPWVRAIKVRTSLRSKPNAMPPWFIEKDIGIQQYKGDISLSDDEIDKIARWADNGAPQGNPADIPPPLKFLDATEWQIGKPDLIVSTRPIMVKADAPDWWGQLPEVPSGQTEDRYVAAVEVKEVNDRAGKPSGRQTIGGLFTVHHLVWATVSPGGGFPGADGGYPVHEVGRNADFFDPDQGRLLKAGSKLIFTSIHTHSSGVDTNAHLEIGFKFHPKGYQPKPHRPASLSIPAMLIDIRAMEANQKIESFKTLTENVKMTVFEPHMHATGVRMCLDAIVQSTVETLTCTGYNHGWVRAYQYADSAAPLLPKGTILRLTGYFDNTPGNRNVVDPRNWSGLGHRSIDNMMVDIGAGFALTDEEFAQAMSERVKILHVKAGQTVLGCPLCTSVKVISNTAGQQ
jgi:hypothetical protein